MRRTATIFGKTCFILATAAQFACAGEPVVYGITGPRYDSTISAQVPGAIGVIHHREGKHVRQGDIIIELESDLERLEVDRRRLISESKVELVSASNKLETLKIDLDGTRRLYESTKSVSKEDLDRKELEIKLAAAEVERMKTEEIRESIEHDMAAAQLERRRVRAPYDGVVTKVFSEVGENCSPQQPLVRIVDLRECRFVAHVDTEQSWQPVQGESVVLTVRDGERTITRNGSLVYVAPVIDPASALCEVHALFDNADGKLKPGMAGGISPDKKK